MTQSASLSFEDACAAAAMGDQGVDHVKHTVFAKPLSELKRLQSEWGRTHAELQGRFARAEGRMQQAMKTGLNFDHIARLGKPFLDQLIGDGAAHPGLLNDTGLKIDRSIALMESFTAKQLHDERHVWSSWPNLPARVRDNIRAAESIVGELERLVADGGIFSSCFRHSRRARPGRRLHRKKQNNVGSFLVRA